MNDAIPSTEANTSLFKLGIDVYVTMKQVIQIANLLSFIRRVAPSMQVDVRELQSPNSPVPKPLKGSCMRDAQQYNDCPLSWPTVIEALFRSPRQQICS